MATGSADPYFRNKALNAGNEPSFKVGRSKMVLSEGELFLERVETCCLLSLSLGGILSKDGRFRRSVGFPEMSDNRLPGLGKC